MEKALEKKCVNFDPVLRISVVISHIGIGRSTLYLWISQGKFPPPFKLGERIVGWRLSVVENWITQRGSF